MKKTKTIEYHGRGVSFVDSIQIGLLFDQTGNIVTDPVAEDYRPGTLRFKKYGRSAIPVIQYDGSTHDELCIAFQAETDNHNFVDFDVKLLADALTYYLKSQGKL